MYLSYPIQLADEVIGTARIQQQGLYWKIHCQCKISGEVIYRVLMCCGLKQVDLGILVPCEYGFEIDTKVPIKRIGINDFTFHAAPRHEKMTGRFVPIYPEEPFSYLQQLQKAYLEKRGEQIGIVLPEVTG